MTQTRAQWVSGVLVLVAVMCGAASLTGIRPKAARAQDKATKAPERSFISLRDERDQLEKNLRDVQKEVDDLTLQQTWLQIEAAAKRDLEERQKDKKTPPEQLAQLKKTIADARLSSATLLSLEDVKKALEQKQVELKDKKHQRDLTEAEISRKIDLEKPKQEFKTRISGYFTLLIGLVIIGFFVVALRDPTVRREIFSGQAGIQFITLFSVVIAIILFGVTEILEGKELAALLGGLSGYILGRSTAASTAPSHAKAQVSSPVITDISPKTGTLGAAATSLPVQIVGSDLQLANSVKIVRGAKEIPVSEIRSNDLAISCTLTLDPSLPKGAYDIIVTNSDGGVAKLSQAFTIN